MLNVYSILNANQAVKDLLADGSRLRVWGWGYASEQEVGTGANVKPYCVWQIASDEQEQLLTCSPKNSSMIYQFDVYGSDGDKLPAINSALQYALRLHGSTTSVRHPTFQIDGTKLYRAGFDFHFVNLME